VTRAQREFGKESTAAEVIEGHDLGGQDVIVTGGANGLGLETARALAGAGARVVIAGRNPQQGESVVTGFRADTGNAVEFGLLDLASLDSVSAFVQSRLATGRPLHVLVNNAGVMATPLSRTA
jgi:NAD(P)-dependent dehydrogenase (short-subunit alcohol dehydrogenase family)